MLIVHLSQSLERAEIHVGSHLFVFLLHQQQQQQNYNPELRDCRHFAHLK